MKKTRFFNKKDNIDIDSDIKYDAFISYNHADNDIAETLHKKIERYHIPRVIRQITGKNKFERVFRDKEELPLSSDLTQKIYDALDSSEYLIVVCSLEGTKSLWVKKEVEYFLNNHDKKHILIVWVDGEQNDVFPPIFCGENIPLAADIRANSKKESLKKLNSEFLRLIAGMLEVPYDLLKQRHKEYIIKRTIAICAVVAITIGSFTGYSYVKNKKLQEQKEELALKESTGFLESGFREDALNSILSLGENSSFSSNTTYALNNALYSYKTAWNELVPERTLNLSNVTKQCLSKDETQCYAINKNGKGYVLSLDTGKVEWKLDNEELGCSEIKAIIPYEDYSFLEIGKNGKKYVANICDSKTKKIIKTFSLEHDFGNTESYYIKNNTFVWASTSYLTIYDLGKGECIQDIDLTHNTGISDLGFLGKVTISSNENGNKIYLGFSSYDFNKTYEYLQVYDTEKNEFKTISSDRTEYVSVLDDGRIVAIQDVNSSISSYLDYPKYYIAIYDENSLEQLAKSSELITISTTNMGILQNENTLLVWIGNQFFAIDSQTGKSIVQFGYDSDILSVENLNDNHYLVTTDDGWIQYIGLGDSVYRYDCMNLKNQIDSTYFFMKNSLYKDGKMLILTNGKVVLLSVVKDPYLKKVEEVKKVDSIEYLENETGIYRLVKLYDNSSFYITEVALYKTNSDKCICRYTCKENYDIYEVKLSENELCIVEEESTTDNLVSLHKININSQKETNIDLSSLQISSKKFNIHFNSDCSKLLYVNNTSLIEYDITDKIITTIDNINNVQFLDSIDKFYFTDDSNKYYIYNVDTDEVIETEFSSTSSINVKAIAKESEEFLFEVQDSICIMDTTSGSIIKTIPLPSVYSVNSSVSCSFFNHDHSILVSIGKNIYLYDKDSGDILDSYTYTTKDEALNENDVSLTIITNKNSNYFALKDYSDLLGDNQRNMNQKMLLIYTVNNQNKIYPYAQVAYGYTNFDVQEIAISSGNNFYYSSFYDEETLKERAKELVESE